MKWQLHILHIALILSVFFLTDSPVYPEAVGDNSQSSTEIKSTLDAAKDHFFARRYNIALRLFNRVLELDPENAEAYSFSGDVLLQMGRLDEAADRFRIASEIGKNPSREFFRLGQTLYLQKKREKALEAFRESLIRDPMLHINRFYIGLVYLRLFQDAESTIEHWLAFRRLAPDDPQGPEIDRAIEILRRKGYTPDLFADDSIEDNRQGPGGGCYPVSPCMGIQAPGAGQAPAAGQAPGAGQAPAAGQAPGTGQAPAPPELPLPPGSEQPFMQGDPEAEKRRDKKKSIIEIEDL